MECVRLQRSIAAFICVALGAVAVARPGAAPGNMAADVGVPSAAPPAIRAIEIVSRPPDGRRAYAIGEAIELLATFDGVVDVDDRLGTPAVTLSVGEKGRDAAYVGGSGSSELRFSWTVAEGALDDDGVAVAANRLTLNGGAIQGSGNVDAMLAHPALTVSPAHKVDAVRPALLEGPAALAVSGRTLRLFFDETLDPQSVPASDAFTIFDSVTGDVTQRIADVSVRGAVVELSLGAPAPPGETPPSVTYTTPLQPAGALRDAVSNAVASFTATSDASAAASEGSNDNGQPASRGRPAAAVAEHRGSLAPRT